MSLQLSAISRKIARGTLDVLIAAIALLPLLVVALVARFCRRRGIGLGPEPLINNVHHAKALRRQGFRAATFVSHEYYITQDFDVRRLTGRPFNHYALFLQAIFSYEGLYIYFNGGPLAWTALRRFEPGLYRLANVKVVVMPYGGDVQDFAVNDDVVYRAAYLKDYPDFIRRQMAKRRSTVQRWTRRATWVIAGCDWVRYLPYWDTLMLAHFSIDTEEWRPGAPVPEGRAGFTSIRPLRILHAPNHRTIKGTALIERAVSRLQSEGLAIELVVVQKMPNHELRKIVQEVDIVAEQLVIGWYGLFALEAMACAKPVLTYIAPELERLYIHQGLLEAGELPVLRIDHLTLEAVLRSVATGGVDLVETGQKSRQFVLKHHSLAAVGEVFKKINHEIGIEPTERPA